MTTYTDYTGKYVVVSTNKDSRGVFYGICKFFDREKLVCTLTDARMVVRWGKETKGFNGLAATGPLGDSLVSTAAPEHELHGVSSVMLCSDEANQCFAKL